MSIKAKGLNRIQTGYEDLNFGPKLIEPDPVRWRHVGRLTTALIIHQKVVGYIEYTYLSKNDYHYEGKTPLRGPGRRIILVSKDKAEVMRAMEAHFAAEILEATMGSL